MDPWWPLRTFDIIKIYDNYGPFIDFVLYTIFFTSIAYTTIGRRFKHRGLAMVLGLMLATALATTAPLFGFNLKTLGPYAGGVFVLIIGIFLYGIIRHFRVDRLGAVCVAFTLAYLTMLVYTPDFVGWLTWHIPLLSFIIVVTLTVGLFKLIPRLAGQTPALVLSESGTDQRVLKGMLGLITKRATKDSEQIIADLEAVTTLLEVHGDSRQARAEIAKRLAYIPPREHDLVEKVEAIKALLQQLRTFDLKRLARLKTLPAEEQEKAKKKIEKELEGLEAIETAQKFGEAVGVYQEYFRTTLQEAFTFLSEGQPELASKALERSVDAEKKAIKLLKKMEAFEASLQEVTEKL